MAINIGFPPGSSSGSEGACLFSASTNNTINYGTQVPQTGFSPFLTVQDNDDPSRGPAFYFQAFYDKVVVVPETDLPQSSSQKRSADPYIKPQWMTRNQVAPGDKPWFCYWNGTFLEGFVYANNYTGSAGSQSSSTSPATSTAFSSSYSSSATSGGGSSSGPQQTSTPPPYTSSYSAPPYTSSYSAPPYTSTYSAPPSSTPAPARRFMERQADSYGELTPFGYIVKIEERRIQDSPSPYCVKMQLLYDGTANFAPDDNGNPITITLSENDPGYSAYQSAGLTKKRSDTVAGGCHCQWWSGAA